MKQQSAAPTTASRPQRRSLTVLVSTVGVLLLLSLYNTAPATAATPSSRPATRSAVVKTSSSPSPQPSGSPTTPTASAANASTPPAKESTLNLRERLQKVLGDTIGADHEQRRVGGYIGEVTRVSEEAITVRTLTSSEIIAIDSETRLLKRNVAIPVSEISVGNWLVVIGSREKNDAINPQILILQTTALKPKEHLVAVSTIQEIGRSSITILPRGKTDPVTVTVGKNSKLTDNEGESITLAKLPKDVAAIVVAYISTNGSWELGTLKTLMKMDEFKSAPTPSPSPRPVVRRSPTPRPATTPTPAGTATPAP